MINPPKQIETSAEQILESRRSTLSVRSHVLNRLQKADNGGMSFPVWACGNHALRQIERWANLFSATVLK